MARAICILVVDPEPIARRVVVARFAARGWDVIEATSDAEALDALTADAATVDMVVTERPPIVFRGSDLTKRIRSIPGPSGATPIVVMSSLDRPSDIASVLVAGADGFISKPFDLVDLEAEVQRVLADRHRAGRSVAAS